MSRQFRILRFQESQRTFRRQQWVSRILSAGVSAVVMAGVVAAEVTSTGTYTTSIPIEVPPGPGAPSLSLTYSSASRFGIAGTGWDISVGWPTLIIRDTRNGTPSWSYGDAWLFGSTPLVSTAPSGCQSSRCDYRTSPDSLIRVSIDVSASSPSAAAVLPNGTHLTYEPVKYDGLFNPTAPPGAQTKVFLFQLRSVEDANAYKTCFVWARRGGDRQGTSARVLRAIEYGPTIKNCDNLSYPPGNTVLSVELDYDFIDTSNPHAIDYFAPMSYRMGAPIVYDRFLTSIAPSNQYQYTLQYYASADTETRAPLLKSVKQTYLPTGSARILRYFRYGARQATFGVPQILDVGDDVQALPPSLSGSETRLIRQPQFINNPAPAGWFQIGNDQIEDAAPPSYATTKQWTLMDINGDGLLDTVVADEHGFDLSWPTYEPLNSNPGPPPAQQWAFINEGIQGSSQTSTKVILHTTGQDCTDPTSLNCTANPVSPPSDPISRTRWIWSEGQGMTRVGMPVSTASPEIVTGGKCPPFPGQDTRIWPYLPDGSIGGSSVTAGEAIGSDLLLNYDGYSSMIDQLVSIANAYIPRHTVSATLSGWLDLNADGIPDWVVTPGMIEYFDRDIACFTDPNNPVIPNAHNPHAEGLPWWYVAIGDGNIGQQTRTTRVPPSVQYQTKSLAAPSTPVGLPLSFSDQSNQSDSFGLTLPFGTLISNASSLSSQSSTAAVMALIVSLVADSLTPRGRPGPGSISFAPTTRDLMQLTLSSSSVGDFVEGAGNFLMSPLRSALDYTLIDGGNDGRSQLRSQVVDFNGDGFPDYLLYDSAGILDSTRKGDLLLFLNDGKGGFSGPQRINTGFEYSPPTAPTSTSPDSSAISNAANDAVCIAVDILNCFWGVPATVEICRAALDSGYGYIFAAILCSPLAGEVLAVANDADTAANLAKSFLNSSTDTLPGERSQVTIAHAMADASRVSLLPFILLTPPGPGLAGQFALYSAETAKLIDKIVRDLDYPSKLNLLSKGMSHMHSGNILGSGEEGRSIQTTALVDLNGDGLPDFVISEDREKVCAPGKWDVYWGTGKGFAPTPTCIEVPPPPPDLSRPTLPLQVDMIQEQQAGNSESDTKTYSLVSLIDFNQDGRPDLLIAKTQGKWDPRDTSNTWTVYLNNGQGFDLTRPLSIPSVSVSLNIGPASWPGSVQPITVAYPGLRSGRQITAIDQTRSIDNVDVSFIDVNADGTADIAQRIWYSPYFDSSGKQKYRAGILYWSRAGTDPQDLLIEVRDPLEGSRELISYLPAPRFQWPNGIPNGAPPPGGHRPAIGSTAFLVSSVTNEPMLGRNSRRTRIGYDYKDPWFDPIARGFGGFATLTKTPLDPTTGSMLALAISTKTSNSQLDQGRAQTTHARTVDNSNGALVRETFEAYKSILRPGTSGNTTSYLTKPIDHISVEYPPNLHFGPILDVSFDGRTPLANNATRVMSPDAVSSFMFNFDPEMPTGGGISLNGSQWIRYDLASPVPPHLSQITVELWISPQPAAAPETIVSNSGFSLSRDSSGNLLFSIQSSSGQSTVNGQPLLDNVWSHIIASYDGNDLRIFINGHLTGHASASTPIAAEGPTFIGCSVDIASGSSSSCFSGGIGELRIYPEGWSSPPRITRTLTAYEENQGSWSFGFPTKLWNFGDIARPDGDFYQETSYAAPVMSGVGSAIATVTRRAIQPDGSFGCYLKYSENMYDGLNARQVSKGNLTDQGVYSGPQCVNVAPKADTFIHYIYSDATCPGKVTELHDPLDAVTKTSYDSSCTFPISVTNAFGHQLLSEYFGVNGTPNVDPSTGFSGPYGQIKSKTDANGAKTQLSYDAWGRVTENVGPYDTVDLPGELHFYGDAQCIGTTNLCSDPTATQLAAPSQTAHFTRDDMLRQYRGRFEFSDGQSEDQGSGQWIVSGTKDFDLLGRVTTIYKPRYLPAQCPSPPSTPSLGNWCDSDNIPGNPLRDPSFVAHVQTAFDSRGRPVRVYGTDIPACADPSALDSNGNMICDAGVPATGHITRIDYPEIGATRTTNALGVPTIRREDAQGRIQRVEEYTKASSSSPYSTVDYTYDVVGNLVGTTDLSGNSGTATYDSLGRKASTTDPDMGTWKYEYDKRGQIITQYDAADKATENKYDILGRLLETRYSTTAVTDFLNYTFDGGPGDSEISNPVIISPQGVASNLWRIAPQVRTQRQFSPIPFQWEQNVNLTPLMLQPNSSPSGGVALLGLPFDFALTPNHVWSSGRTTGTVVPVTGKNFWGGREPIYINTNGKIRFDSGGLSDTGPGSGFNLPLPTPDGQIGLYPFWTHLLMPPNSPGLSYAVVGSHPYQHLIIEWDGTDAITGTQVQFRAVLYETYNEVQYQYKQIPLGYASATIGLQNKGTAGSGAVVVSDGVTYAAPVSTGQSLSSSQTLPYDVLVFNNGASYGVNQATNGSTSFDVNLTDAVQATLSFRNSWNTRCVQYALDACPIDHMEVDFDTGYGPQLLVPETNLIADNALNAGLDGISNAPLVSVQFPHEAIGKLVRVSFTFSSLDGGTTDPSFGWMVDDIHVAKRVRTQVEDVVARSYDSAELVSSYSSSNPVLDLTFDVPGSFQDRASTTTTIRAVSVTSTVGISGKGVHLGESSVIYVDNSYPPFGNALTAEMWVNPDSYENPGVRPLLVQQQVFALKIERRGELGCYVYVGAAWHSVVSRIPIPLHSWTHLAMTYDGAKLFCYVDGVSTSPGIISGSLGYSGMPIVIGGTQVGSLPYQGFIDEVRVFSKRRSTDEIVSDMMSPLRHGPPRGNVLDLRFSDTRGFLLDDSGANNQADQTPGVIMLPGVEGNAAAFGGRVGEHIHVPTSLAFQSSSVTAEAWVKTWTQSEALLIGQWDGTNPGWRLAINNISGQVRFEVITRTSSSSPPTLASFVTLQPINNDGAWHHVAGVYDAGTGFAGSLMVYIDGKPAWRTCTSTNGADWYTCIPPPPDSCSTAQRAISGQLYGNAVCANGTITSSLDVYIGNYDPATPPGINSSSLQGMLDEVRVSNYAKRDFEVLESAQLYSAYSQLLGRKAEMRNQSESENNSYDLLERSTTTHKVVDSHSYIIRTAFDNSGRAATLRYPDGEVTRSAYDLSGTEVSLVGFGNDTTHGGPFYQSYLGGANVDVVGRLRWLEFGNGAHTSLTYNDQASQAGSGGTFGDELLATLITWPRSGDPIQNQTYRYDPVGNLLSRSDQPSRLHSAPVNATYLYDDLNRLSHFQTKYQGSTSFTPFTGDYSYDPTGNITSKDGLTLSYAVPSGWSNCGQGASSLPHAVKSTAGIQNKQYCYDKNGRLTTTLVASGSSTQTEATFDHGIMGKLIHIDQKILGQTFDFAYDGNGQRVKKIGPDGTTIEPFEFYRVTPRGSEKYYFAHRRMIARRLVSNVSSLSWYHPEQLGSTNLMTDVNGQELQGAYSEYYPYGSALPTSANNTNGPYSGQNTPDASAGSSGSFQFTGKELDGSGFYFYDSRYYDPALGRFLEPDAVRPGGQGPQSLNRYSYVQNNPLKYSDPSGHQAESNVFGRVSNFLGRAWNYVVWGDEAVGPQPDKPIVVAGGVPPSPRPMPTQYQRPPLREFQWRAPMDEVDRNLFELKRAVMGVGAVVQMSFDLNDYLLPGQILLGVPALEERATGLAFEELGSASLLDKGLELGSARTLSRAEEIREAMISSGKIKEDMFERYRTISVQYGRLPNGEVKMFVAQSGRNEVSLDFLNEGEQQVTMGMIRAGGLEGVPGIDAEQKIFIYFANQGIEPVAGAATRSMCPRCRLLGTTLGEGMHVLEGGTQFVFPGGGASPP
jgi:RHS repeat-associated protein